MKDTKHYKDFVNEVNELKFLIYSTKAVSFFNQLEIRMFASVRNINGLLTDIRDIKRNKYNLNQYIQNYAYHDLNSPVLMELIKEGKI